MIVKNQFNSSHFLARLFFFEKHKSYCYHSVVIGVVGVVSVVGIVVDVIVVGIPQLVKVCVTVTL